MAKLCNLARMTTATTGTGTITLGAAVSGYLTFAQAGVNDGDIVSYGINDGTNSEVGTGTYAASGTTLTRTVTSSTNSNAAISLSGTAQVFITPRAADLVTPALHRGHLCGLTLSAAGSTATFGVAAGVATDSSNVDMLSLASAYAKTTAAWAAGSGNGALDTGSIAASTWYHAYLIKHVDTGVVDVLVSLSATSPTLPASYTLSRRIGAMKTDGSSNWVAFTQNGDEFLLLVGMQDINTSVLGTTAVLNTMTVPTGVKVNVLIGGLWGENAAQTFVLLSSPDQTDTAPTLGILSAILPAGTNVTCGSFNIRTNTSGQIRMRASNSTTTLVGTTQGWIDRRGRDA